MSGAEAGAPSFGMYFAALRRKWWLVAIVAAIGVGSSAYAVSRTEDMFSSMTLIQLPEERSGGGGGGLAGLAASVIGGGGSLTSQMQVLRSRLLLGQVVDSLNLRLHREVGAFPRNISRPVGWVDQVRIAPGMEGTTLDFVFGPDQFEVRTRDRVTTAAYGQLLDLDGIQLAVKRPAELEEATVYVVWRDQAIDALQADVHIYPRDGTNLLEISSNGYDRDVTKRISDATALIYQRFTTQRSRDQAERSRRFLEQQLVTTDSILRDIQDELTAFRSREGLYSYRAQAELDQTEKSSLEVRAAELQGELQIARGLVQRLETTDQTAAREALRAIISSPGMGNNTAIMAAYELLTTQEAQRLRLLSGRTAMTMTSEAVVEQDQLIENTRRDLVALARGHIQALEAQLEAIRLVRSRVDQAFQHLAVTEPQEVRLMLRMEAISEAANVLREQYYTAGMAEASIGEQVTILDLALPGGFSGSGRVRTILLGLIFGLMVGSAGAILLDGRNRSIRRREEVEQLLRVPGLGVIPRVSPMGGRLKLRVPVLRGQTQGGKRTAGGGELVTASQVHSPAAEAFRAVRTNLTGWSAQKTPTSIMVTSPSAGEGKSTTAANLAVTFAQQGRRVLLMDCDLRRPSLHTVFGVGREPGLGDVLLGNADVREVIRTTDVAGLSLLPAGAAPTGSPADLIGDGAIQRLLGRLEQDYDLVVLDSPPVLLTSDAPILATQVAGVLVVIRAGQTDRETANYALHQLTTLGARVMGAVLNDPDATLNGYVGAYGAPAYAE